MSCSISAGKERCSPCVFACCGEHFEPDRSTVASSRTMRSALLLHACMHAWSTTGVWTSSVQFIGLLDVQSIFGGELLAKPDQANDTAVDILARDCQLADAAACRAHAPQLSAIETCLKHIPPARGEWGRSRACLLGCRSQSTGRPSRRRRWSSRCA